ncbi:MAG: aspartate aminotransferase family protein, partial [Hyphomicrobiales bacterium]
MADELRQLLGRAVDHAVAYRQSLSEGPGKPAADYYSLREAMAAPLPETGTVPEAVLEELVERSTPGLMPMAGPRFFGFVIGASHPAGVAADWMVSAWGQNAGYHTPTPAAAAIEEVAEGWLVDILDLPKGSSVGFVTGATVANAVGLSAARTKVLLDTGWDADADG